jgi:hypothetical protein
MHQDDDDFVNADINRALAKMRDISRKFPLDLHPNGVALPIAAAFIRSLPYVDKFLKKGEAFAAVLQKEDSFQGDLELVMRSERQSESLFIMQVRATNRAIAIINGMWVEIADRLVHFSALSHELAQAQHALTLKTREYDDFADLLLKVSNEPENREAARLLGIKLSAPVINRINELEARIAAFEAALAAGQLAPAKQEPPDGERNAS